MHLLLVYSALALVLCTGVLASELPAEVTVDIDAPDRAKRQNFPFQFVPAIERGAVNLILEVVATGVRTHVINVYNSVEIPIPAEGRINYGANTLVYEINGTTMTINGIELLTTRIELNLDIPEMFQGSAPEINLPLPAVLWHNAPSAIVTTDTSLIAGIRGLSMLIPPPVITFETRAEGGAGMMVVVLEANGEDILTLTGARSVSASGGQTVSYVDSTVFVRQGGEVIQEYTGISTFRVANGLPGVSERYQTFMTSAPMAFSGPGKVWVNMGSAFFSSDQSIVADIDAAIVSRSVAVMGPNLVNPLMGNQVVLRLDGNVQAAQETNVMSIEYQGDRITLRDSVGQVSGFFDGINQFSYFANSGIETLNSGSSVDFSPAASGILFRDSSGNAFFSTDATVSMLVLGSTPEPPEPVEPIRFGFGADTQGVVTLEANGEQIFTVSGTQRITVPELFFLSYDSNELVINNNFNMPVARFEGIERFVATDGASMFGEFLGSAPRSFGGPGTLYLGSRDAFYTSSTALVTSLESFRSSIPPSSARVRTTRIGTSNIFDATLTVGGEDVVQLTGGDASNEGITTDEAILYNDNTISVIGMPFYLANGLMYSNNTVTGTNAAGQAVSYPDIMSLRYYDGAQFMTFTGSAPSGSLRGGQLYFNPADGSGEAFLSSSSVITDTVAMAIRNTGGVVRRTVTGDINQLGTIIGGVYNSYNGSASLIIPGGGRLYTGGGSGFYTTSQRNINSIKSQLIQANPTTTTITTRTGGFTDINIMYFNRTLVTVSGGSETTSISSGQEFGYNMGNITIGGMFVAGGINMFYYFDGTSQTVFQSNSSATFTGPGLLIIDRVRMIGFFTDSSQAQSVITSQVTAVRDIFRPPEIERPVEREIVDKSTDVSVLLGTDFLTVYRGATVSFDCTVSIANPEPEYRFFVGTRNNTIVADGVKYNITGDRLTVIDVDSSDDNFYGCVASNSAGSSSARSHLSVDPAVPLSLDGNFIPYRPTPYDAVIPLQDVTLDESVTLVINRLRSLAFSCRLNGRPKPPITWMVNGVTASETDRVTITSPRPGTSIYSIAPPYDTINAVLNCFAEGSSVQGQISVFPQRYSCMPDRANPGECSATCGAGLQVIPADCNVTENMAARRVELSEVPVELGFTTTFQLCTRMELGLPIRCPGSIHEPYRFRVEVGEFGECNATCNTGYQNRTAECVRYLVPEGEEILADREVVENGMCFMAGLEVPPSLQLCNRFACPYWSAGAFGECSVTCGGGISTRPVVCRTRDPAADPPNGIVPDEDCDPDRRPEVSVGCCDFPCPFAWRAGAFGACEDFCQIRQIHCVNLDPRFAVDNVPVDDSFCAGLPRPHTGRHCDAGVCRRGIWIAGDLGACSRTCGRGMQSREVFCVDNLNLGNLTVIDPGYCIANPTPPVVLPCFEQNCPGECIMESSICPLVRFFGLCNTERGADCCASCPHHVLPPPPIVTTVLSPGPTPVPVPLPSPLIG